MVELVNEHQRDQAALELRFMHAVRIAVPACLDPKGTKPFEKREETLLRQTQ